MRAGDFTWKLFSDLLKMIFMRSTWSRRIDWEPKRLRNPLKYDLILLEAIPTMPRWEFIRDKEEIIFNISRFNTHRAAETAKELKSSAYFSMDFRQLARWLREVERQIYRNKCDISIAIMSNILLISSPPQTLEIRVNLRENRSRTMSISFREGELSHDVCHCHLPQSLSCATFWL